ncbi:hypothetical protein OH492_01205 [Vibrio chagasii]|nr:hypothetical protein [Vibrio chagasii]
MVGSYFYFCAESHGFHIWWREQRQTILLDIGSQQFNFFGTTLYPQDLTLLAILFMIAAFGLFFITTFWARVVWLPVPHKPCGPSCTSGSKRNWKVLPTSERKQDSGKLTTNLMIRKTIKHIAWWAIAIATGSTFVGYFIPIKERVVGFFYFFNSSRSQRNVLGTVLRWFVLMHQRWLDAFDCLSAYVSYARFQSAMFDKDTFIVGYDTERGEPRSSFSQGRS